MRLVPALFLALATLASPIDAQRGRQEAGFPHGRHDRLFPLCESCHAGIATGNAATTMPTEASCRECHNGTDERAVTWRPTARGAGLLRFSHPAHAAEVDSAGRRCAACHATPGASRRMDVGRARPQSCQACHTHQASAHLGEDNRCAACHVPLTVATGLGGDRIAALPRP